MATFPPRWRRRLRAWVRRSSIVWWSGALVLALVTGGFVRSSLDRSAAVAARYGALRSVPVVAAPVAAGEVVEVSDVRVERRPASTIPDGEVADAGTESDAGAGGGAGGGRVALVPLVAGEVLLASKLAPAGLRGAAALLPAGMRALAVPPGPGGRSPLEIGDRVDVLATAAPVDAEAPPTVVVAEAALVVALDDASDTVTIAVPADDAPHVAYAITAASITLALTAPAP